MDAPAPAAPPAPAPEAQERRSSSRAARPAAGALSVANLERRSGGVGGVFGGRRKAGEPRESLYVKGTEPENVVEVTGPRPPPAALHPTPFRVDLVLLHPQTPPASLTPHT